MSKHRLRVISRHGDYHFQTGMITATLLRRGIPMDKAFDLARDLRHRFDDRESVTTDELAQGLRALVRERLGDIPDEPEDIAEPPAPIIRTRRHATPFSRGILLRQLTNIGLSTERSMKVLDEVMDWLSRAGTREVAQEDLDAFLARRLGRLAGTGYARRYKLVRWVEREEHPVIIFIGGATGTGKSTLAMELGYRLGIRVAISTDMIRETLRSVLSPEIVPQLHDHSFRGMLLGGTILSDPKERVLAGFRQQAEQVSVGIRAVIRRAVRERASMIIEGTHLLPPYDQYLPKDTDVITAGLTLAVQEQAGHLSRFPERDRGSRPAQPYLNSFQAVRWIHDDLLRLAEESEEVVVLAKGDATLTATAALSYLSQAFPVDPTLPRERSAPPPVQDRPRSLFLILDGLGDEPIPSLGGLTPLQAAHTPTLRALAATGAQGLVELEWKDIHPNTSDAMAILLGLDDSPGDIGRGLLEAMGAAVSVPEPSVVLRGNLASVRPDGTISDRRSGRIRETAALLAGLQRIPLPGGVRGFVLPGHEHRVTVVLHGQGLSSAVSNTDPGNRAPEWRMHRAAPTDDSPEAMRTATALNALLDGVAQHLAEHPVNRERVAAGLPVANAVITRGPAHTDDLEKLPTPQSRAALVSGCRTSLGVARLTGMQVATSPRMTGSLDTDLEEKFRAAETLLAAWDVVVVHIKGTDIAAHDKLPEAKRDFIEKVDAALGRFLKRMPTEPGLQVLVTADHGTSSVTGVHTQDPAPVLLATWRGETSEQADFDEQSATRGALGTIHGRELFDLLVHDS